MEPEKPRALDLFCGAGGATRGLQLAGFHVTGVDLKKSPRYCGEEFHQADALTFPLDGFDLIWASPPCQHYSPLNHLHKREYPQLIEPIRARLIESGAPYIIENVPGSPLVAPGKLCGSMFGLDVRRHRLFETNFAVLWPRCNHRLHTPRFSNTGKRRRAVLSSVVGVYGGGHFKGDTLAYRSAAMGGVDWMSMDELSESIPPAYSQHIAEYALLALAAKEGRCG